jgi:hypothetical protein
LLFTLIFLGIFLVVNAILLIYIAYFKSYGTKSGEIKAIEDNIQTLVRQNEALTKSTEDIRAQMSKEHREWEFKKDVLREVARAVVSYQEAVVSIASAAATVAKNPPGSGYVNAEFEAAHERAWKARSEFAMSRILVAVTYEREVIKALENVEVLMDEIGAIPQGTTPEAIDSQCRQLNIQIDTLLNALRKELMTREREAELVPVHR